MATILETLTKKKQEEEAAKAAQPQGMQPWQTPATNNADNWIGSGMPKTTQNAPTSGLGGVLNTIGQGIQSGVQAVPGFIKSAMSTLPTPTVATPTNPIVNKETVGVVKENVPLAINRDNYEKIIATDPSKLTEEQRGFIRIIQSRTNEGKSLSDIFGEKTTTGTGTTTATVPAAPTSEVAIAAKQTALAQDTQTALENKRKELDALKANRLADLRLSGEKVLQAAQAGFSGSGFGRSTLAQTKAVEIQQNIENQAIAEAAKSDQEYAIYKAEREGADAKTIGAMRKQLDDHTAAVQKLAFDTATKVAELNAANKVKGQEAMNNFLSALDSKSKDQLQYGGFDDKLSAKMGYAVDKFGKPLTDANGNKLEFGTKGVSDSVESYAQEIAKGNANISSVPEDQRDAVINRVAGIRGENKTASSSVNEFRAEKILGTILNRNIDKQKDGAYLGFVTNLLDKGKTESEVYSELGSANLQNTAFVAGNQKLFDDMQKDAKNFTDMKGSFTNMNAIVKDAIASKDEQSKASADQALITLFNKMLDPGSVVREGEYDRTSQGQSLLSQASGYLSRLQQGGAAITDETRADMARIAQILYKQAEKGMAIRRGTYESIAQDVGGDPKFVKRYFDGQLQTNTQSSTKAQDRLKAVGDIFGISAGTTTEGTPKEKSVNVLGKEFKLNFNQAEPTASTNGLDFSSNQSIIDKYPNEAAFKNNNPTGITARINKNTKKLLADYGIEYEVGTARPKNEGGSYFKFPDVQTGMNAYALLLTKAGTNDIYDRLKQWVGTSNGDNYAREIMDSSGIPKGTKFDDLTQEQLVKLMQEQLKRESPNFYREIQNIG